MGVVGHIQSRWSEAERRIQSKGQLKSSDPAKSRAQSFCGGSPFGGRSFSNLTIQEGREARVRGGPCKVTSEGSIGCKLEDLYVAACQGNEASTAQSPVIRTSLTTTDSKAGRETNSGWQRLRASLKVQASSTARP